MLVLTRKYGEKIMIGDNIVITVLEARGDAVRVGIEAPAGVSLKRAEVYDEVSAENQSAAAAGAAGIEENLRDALGQPGTSASAPGTDPDRLPGS
jgi:carbon storage regulator